MLWPIARLFGLAVLCGGGCGWGNPIKLSSCYVCYFSGYGSVVVQGSLDVPWDCL